MASLRGTDPALAEGEARKPNVLFLFTDDQRPDTIRTLGNERIQTLGIDRLVKRGVSFDNAYIMGSTSDFERAFFCLCGSAASNSTHEISTVPDTTPQLCRR